MKRYILIPKALPSSVAGTAPLWSFLLAWAFGRLDNFKSGIIIINCKVSKI